MTSPIELTRNDVRRRLNGTAIDNTDLLQTSSKATGSHHHYGYATVNSITSSTTVRVGCEIANEISNLQPQTEKNLNAIRTAHHYSYAEKEMVFDQRSAREFLIR